tara:strand:+ start:3269 stop:3499 length:231 start_codon:yes stop_codon:yes gene_type:complete
MYELLLGIELGILIIVLINLFISQKDLKSLYDKQQSTMYGVSHIWGSIMEFRKELEAMEARVNIGNLEIKELGDEE